MAEPGGWAKVGGGGGLTAPDFSVATARAGGCVNQGLKLSGAYRMASYSPATACGGSLVAHEPQVA